MHNPGSVYQAYALQQYLIKYNQEVEIIDYRQIIFYKRKFWNKILYKKLLLINYINQETIDLMNLLIKTCNLVIKLKVMKIRNL